MTDQQTPYNTPESDLNTGTQENISGFGWFLKCVKHNYANFNGRARRKEYWMFFLFYILLSIGIGIVDGILGVVGIPPLLGLVFSLAMIVPIIAAAARRLHDTGRSGWWQLIGIVPVVGLVLLYFLVIDGDSESNEYGPSPKA